jgi:hypothetical protein
MHMVAAAAAACVSDSNADCATCFCRGQCLLMNIVCGASFVLCSCCAGSRHSTPAVCVGVVYAPTLAPAMIAESVGALFSS